MQLHKMARRLRAKRIWKSKSSKRYGLGTLLEDATSKHGTPPAREAHLEVKIVKALRSWSTFQDATSNNGTPPTREAHLQVKIVKTLRSRSTFSRRNFKKWHVACARSTFGSQKCQSAQIVRQSDRTDRESDRQTDR